MRDGVMQVEQREEREEKKEKGETWKDISLQRAREQKGVR